MADDKAATEAAAQVNEPEGPPVLAPTGWINPEARGDETGGAERVLILGRVAAVTLTLVLVALLARVIQLQTRPPEQIAQRIDTQKSTATIMGRRGAMVDRRGRVVAVTRVAKRLFVDPREIVDRNTFSERVGYTLEYEPAEIEMELAKRSDSRYVVLDQRMDDERLEKFADFELPGLNTEAILVRDYPFGPLGGQVVGFVGRDGVGLEGLEKVLDAKLKPTPGKYNYLRDAMGRPLWVEASSYQNHRDGETQRLSLDMTIQEIAEKQLAATVAEFGAKAGQLIVMDPYTGEIIAMANYPTFDPESFGSSKPELRRNRCVTDVFEPGSIFKPFVWAAATQAGYAKPTEMFDCTTVGWWKPKRGPVLRDAHPQGLLDWDGVLVKSSNIGLAKVAERMGNEKLHNIVTSFGFGSPTGSGLPGELVGIVRPVKKWSATDLTRVPIGQAVAATPMQMVRAFASLANGGELVTPRITAVGPNEPIEKVRVLSPAIAQHTRDVLHRVVLEGTGKKANSKLYGLFGKTGTAQLPEEGRRGYAPDQYVSSFIAGAPVEAPRLIVSCHIHRPDKSKGHYGGTVAAPAVMRVMEESLLYLGVPPRPSPEQVAQRRAANAQ